VIIIAGSKSTQAIIDKVTQILNDNLVDFSVFIASAYRTPELLDEIIQDTKEYAKIYITIAGLSAALPGVVASKVNQPVIGLPVSSKLGGLDSLLSMTQLPSGIPVATVGIDNGKNAAHLALRILNLLD